MADDDIEGSSLTAIIADELRQAQTFDQSKRTYALEYGRGEMRDLPARANGSSQTSRDVADALQWILPGVVRVFTASDQMVEFEATQEGGEQDAEEASEYTNYSFFRENDGYKILYNGTHDSLLMGNGLASSYWCPEERETKTFRNKTEEELVILRDEEGWQFTNVRPTGAETITIDDPMQGRIEVQVPTLTAKATKVCERGQIKDAVLKPDNLFLNPTATAIGERFTAYLHDDKTRSDLIDMAEEYGWDTEVIKNLPRYTVATATEVAQARRFNQMVDDSAPTKSGDLVDLYECYIRLDQDDDGEAELLRVWYAGNAGQGKVLGEAEEWEEDIPFTDIPCYPVPHQWQAEGLYDRLADVQRVKTTLLRQALDNTYAVNMPMREVEAESVLNPDILVNPKFNGLIWKKKGSAPIVPHEIPYTADKSFAAMQMMDEIITKRTGISKSTMALDPEALQNQTATASQNQRDAGYTQIELIARNMAELGWAKFFAKRRNLARRHIKGAIAIPSKNGDQLPPDQMQMQGPVNTIQEGPEQEQVQAGKPSGYRTVQPEAWGDDMACTINVGLGTGSRDRDMAMLQAIQNDQTMLMQMLGGTGFQSEAIEMIPKIAKTATQKAEAAGIKNPDSYYLPFDETMLAKMKQESEQRSQQPPPEVMLEQMKQQGTQAVEQAKAQAQIEVKQIDAQLAQQSAELKAQGDVAKNQAELDADMATKEADRQSAAQLEEQRQAFEWAKFQAELALKREDMQNRQDIELLKLGAQQMSAQQAMQDKQQAAAVDATFDSTKPQAPDMASIMAGLSAAMAAPKRIVRDLNGRAIGVETVTQGAQNA